MKKMRKSLAVFIVTIMTAFALFACGENYALSLGGNSNVALTVGESTTITASLSEFTADVEWSSSDPGVVAVSDGTLTAIAPGTATITATATAPDNKTYSASVTVTVTAPPPTQDDPETPVDPDPETPVDPEPDPEPEPATQVQYSVQHYLQRKDRDGYDLAADRTQSLSTEEGAAITASALDIAGYDFDEGNAQNVLSATASDGAILSVYYNIRVLTVTFKANGANYDEAEVDYGDTVSAPAVDPTKASTENSEFDFAAWQYGGADYEFTAPVTDNITIEAAFTEFVLRTLTVNIVAPVFTVAGKEYSLEFSASDYAAMEVSLTGDITDDTLTVDSTGTITGKLRSGTYSLTVKHGSKTATKDDFTIGERNYTFTLPVEFEASIGGKLGEFSSTTEGDEGNWTHIENATDSVKFKGGAAYAFVDAEESEFTDTYYVEANVAFAASPTTFVGIIAATDNKDLANGGTQLSFAYSGSNCLYRSKSNDLNAFSAFSGVGTAAASSATAHKLALLRSGNEYYIIINDAIATKYTDTEFGESGFGFIALRASAQECAFTGIRYVRSASTVNAILDNLEYLNNLGGSFRRFDGTIINSFGSRWTADANGGGTLTGPSYVFNGGTVGSVYYAEATFTTEKNWVGIMINALDGVPSDNKGWYGYGVLNKKLYMHTTVANWKSGVNKGDVSTAFGSGDTFTLGVARINDSYFVYVNDILVLSECVPAVSTVDNAVTLAADNESGFGLFIGNNFTNLNTFSNFNFSMDREWILKKVGGTATVNYDSSLLTVSQFSTVIESGKILGAGQPATVSFKIPSGQTVSEVLLENNGSPVEYTINGDGDMVFTPVKDGVYTVDVVYTAVSIGSIKIAVDWYSLTVGENDYALYSGDITPADVSVSIYGLGGTEDALTLSGDLTATKSDIATGLYKIVVGYGGNEYSTTVLVESDSETVVNMEISKSYIGGAITIDNSSGVETEYLSYNEAALSATSGSNWALIGERDSVRVTGYTYAFQNEAVGTNYYVEGVFDTTEKFEMYSRFGGLLLAHGPDSLVGNTSDAKLLAGFYGESLVIAAIPEAWSPADTRVLYNLSALASFDPYNVRLGVLRDGTEYLFFIDGAFVARYNYDVITTASGFGVAACASVNITIRDFNFSLNSAFLTALKESAPAAATEIDLYFIAGQSNASGYSTYNLETALVGDKNLVYGNNNVYYAGNAQSSNSSTKVVRPIGWGLARIGQGSVATKFGAEAGMAQSLSKYYNAESGKQAGIIKFAHGGTSLRDVITGENAVGGNWVPPSYQATITAASEELTGLLYRSFLDEVTTRVNELKAMGYTTINFKGLFWMQGESDKSAPELYKTIFTHFASDIRRDLGTIASVDLSAMPIFVGEISRTSGSAVAATVATNDAFISMQNTLPDSINAIYIIESGDYDINAIVNGANVAVGTDSWHWKMADMITIGNLVGDSILENVLGFTA